MKLSKENEKLLRRFIKLTESPLEIAKTFMENQGWNSGIKYKETLETMEIRKQLEEILLNDDSGVSSSKFKQKKLF